jgi:hypothetical protein
MADGNQDEPIRIRAKFHFDGGVEKVFNVALHPKTLELIVPEIPSLPDWIFAIPEMHQLPAAGYGRAMPDRGQHFPPH